MKTKLSRHLILVSGLALAIPLCGCATHGYQRASCTRNELGSARNLAVHIQQEIDVAVSSLDEITAPQPGNLKPPYESFDIALKRLECDVARISKHRQAVRKHADAYYATWEKELGSFETPAIRERSAERRTAVMASLRKVEEDFGSLENSLRPLLLHLRDMKRFLRTDLTMLGVKSATDLTQRIKSDAGEARKNIDSLTSELNRVDTELAPVKYPAEAAPATKETASEPKG